jgi:ABC-type branched-subunit amino acid transport system ATPase component
MTAPPLLEVERVSKAFGALKALEEVSISVPKGRITGLIGPNGSGKSTLFDIITGFQKAHSGTIHFDGERIDGSPPHRIASRGLIRTFQFSEGGERLTAVENLLAATGGQREHNLIAAALNVSGFLHRERENLARARRVLGLLDLKGVANEYVGNLSGGQRKLVDLGRIFMAQPALALLDEPTAGVSPTMIGVILDALRAMNRTDGISLVIVEHNMGVIFEICDYVYVLDTGRLIAEGSAEVVQKNERVLRSYLGRGDAARDDTRGGTSHAPA